MAALSANTAVVCRAPVAAARSGGPAAAAAAPVARASVSVRASMGSGGSRAALGTVKAAAPTATRTRRGALCAIADTAGADAAKPEVAEPSLDSDVSNPSVNLPKKHYYSLDTLLLSSSSPPRSGDLGSRAARFNARGMGTNIIASCVYLCRTRAGPSKPLGAIVNLRSCTYSVLSGAPCIFRLL